MYLALKLKLRKDQSYRIFSLKQKSNSSYDKMRKYEFKDTESITYKQRMMERSKMKPIKTKRNLDENIEPDRPDKFINIKSSENFCPGRAKAESNSQEDSMWNFWKTLKNPLQWFGLNRETEVVSPQKSYAPEDISDNLSIRNRSISYNIGESNKRWALHKKLMP